MRRFIIPVMVLAMVVQGAAVESVHWRGPKRNGAFADRKLPNDWSKEGKNLVWSAPYGTRSTPLVMNGRVYMINRAGDGQSLQERVIALDLKTGKVVWEHRFNAFLTDIVAHRLGWANLAGDPETGYLYAHGVQGEFICFGQDGRIIWKRSLTEEFGRISGYGGRTNTPLIEGDLVLISFLSSGWGPHGRGLHRFLAMDKKTGEVRYWAEPSAKPLDTTYSVPIVVTLDNQRVLFTGLADGSVVAMDPYTGVRKWQFKLSKRGINSSVVYADGKIYATHSEENIDTITMGKAVCLDARTGNLLWTIKGLAAGYTSPILHDGVLYVSDNSANLHCIDATDGKSYWEFNYGKEAKGSPVYADGKIYVGEVSGTYHILKVTKEKCERLHSISFTSPDARPIEIFGTPMVAEGKVLLPTMRNIYCISRGKPKRTIFSFCTRGIAA